MKKSPYLRWVIASFIGLIIFGNHYVRDTVGALEKQIENDLNISSKQYALLNSLYFIPNIVTPIIGGIFAQRIGPSLCLIISLFITTIGNCIFVYGIKNYYIYIYIYIISSFIKLF
jgi:MFS family permease